MYNTLTEPLITVRRTDGELQSLCLPDLYVLLADNSVADFPYLRPHQRHPWHAFLVQLACIACWKGDDTDVTEIPSDAAGWRAALRALTPHYADDQPWHLVVDDVSQPAFMQAPVLDDPPKKPLDCWTAVDTPDDLDVLIASKNHGVKQRVMQAGSVEDWIFALVSLQTHGAYDGKGHQSIARQNGGAASRPGFSLVSTPLPGGQWKRDTAVILQNTRTFPPDYSNPRVALLWLEPWDGESGLSLSELHPLFIEICRRIRLWGEGAALHALRKGTASVRVAGKDMKGNVGDPWIPIHRAEYKAFNMDPTYAKISEILGNRVFRIPLLLQQHPQDGHEGLALQCRVLVRGNKTEGYRERLIPIQGKPSWLMRDSTGEIARQMVDIASHARLKVLKPSLATYLKGYKSKELAYDATEVKSWLKLWLDALDTSIDEHFFPVLWGVLAATDAGEAREDALDRWRNALHHLTRMQLEAGLQSLPAKGLKAEAAARQRFKSLCHKYLPLPSRDKTPRKEEV